MLLKMVENLLFLEAGAGAEDGAGKTKTGAGQKRNGSATLLTTLAMFLNLFSLSFLD